MSDSIASPYELLLEISQTSQLAGAADSLITTSGDQWVGVGFSVNNNFLVADLKQVSEVLAPPSLTPIPNVKPWVLGVANIRGRLIPIIDLLVYSGVEQSARLRNRRVITIEVNDVYVGLVVEQVFGMKYFSGSDLLEANQGQVDKWLQSHVRGSYVDDEHRWLRFDLESLFVNPEFMNVAA